VLIRSSPKSRHPSWIGSENCARGNPATFSLTEWDRSDDRLPKNPSLPRTLLTLLDGIVEVSLAQKYTLARLKKNCFWALRPGCRCNLRCGILPQSIIPDHDSSMRAKTTRQQPLVAAHISGVSVGAIQRQLKCFREFIGQWKCGVYVLPTDGDIYYVGLASSLGSRLADHLKDHHHGKWDQFDLYIIRKGKAKYVSHTLFFQSQAKEIPTGLTPRFQLWVPYYGEPWPGCF
jgi:hypothetical protein